MMSKNNDYGYYNIVALLTIEHSPPGKIPVAELVLKKHVRMPQMMVEIVYIL